MCFVSSEATPPAPPLPSPSTSTCSDIILQFLKDPCTRMRKQAALTCCQVLVQPGRPQFYTGASGKVRSPIDERVKDPSEHSLQL